MKPSNDIDQLIGPPIEVTESMLEACLAQGQFGVLVFDLYREAAGMITICSSTSLQYPGHEIRFERNHAICVGLLVRIAKLMSSIAKLSSETEHGEAAIILGRCVIESAVNLQYLQLRNSDITFDQFIKSSFRPERELYDTIKQNIAQRNGTSLLIEESMLKSIMDKCTMSEVNIEEVNSRTPNWEGTLKERMEAIGFDQVLYNAFQRIPSHAVHGTWMDLISRHLLYHEDGFEPNLEHEHTDGRLLTPIALIAVSAAREYMTRFYGDHPIERFFERLDDIQRRLVLVEQARPDWQLSDAV